MLCQLSFRSLDCESKFAVDSTGDQRFGKPTKITWAPWWEWTYQLEFAPPLLYLGQPSNGAGCFWAFSCHGSSQASQLCPSYLEEDGIQFLQGVHTKKSKDQNSLTVVTDKGDLKFDILLYATGRKCKTQLGLVLKTQTFKSLIVERSSQPSFGNQRSWCLCSWGC